VRANQQDPAQKSWESRLCPECGLCCNGVLFADVRLVKGDEPLVLEKKGLSLKCGQGKITFDQPCACLDGGLCTVYLHRPTRCRSFDCHTLKQAKSAKISRITALRRIRAAKNKVVKLNTLLRQLGNQDEHLPLTKRYENVMSLPVDMSAGEEEPQRRGDLLLTMSDLMDRFHRDFLQ